MYKPQGVFILNTLRHVHLGAPRRWQLTDDAIGRRARHDWELDLTAWVERPVKWVDGHSDAVVAVRGGGDGLARPGHQLGSEGAAGDGAPFVVVAAPLAAIGRRVAVPD